MVGNRILRNQWGLRCVYSELVLRECLFADNLVNGVNVRDGKLIVVNNRIHANRRGIYLQRSDGEIAGNSVIDNSEHGIFLEDSNTEVVDNQIAGNGRAGVRWVNGGGRLARNRLEANGVYALINDGASQVDARNNWWGTSDTARIALAVRDGRDRPGLGLADFRNPLLRPPTNNANQE